MNIMLVALVAVGVFAQNCLNKKFNKNTEGCKNAGVVYSFLLSLAALLVLAVMFAVKRDFNAATLPYAFSFSACFAAAVFFLLLAIKTGSLSLSSLILAFSQIIPTLYGIIFNKEMPSVYGYIGLFCLAVSIILVNTYKKGEKINFKWLIYITLAFIGNGMCATIQKIHQLNVGTENLVCFQFFAMIGSVLIFSVLILILKPNPIKKIFSRGLIPSATSGGINALVNIGMLYLAGVMPAAILYPSVSAGGIALTFVIATLFYKERFSVIQYVGYFLGITAIILLSI